MIDATHWGYFPQRIEEAPDKRISDEVPLDCRALINASDPLALPSSGGIKSLYAQSLYQIARTGTESKSSLTEIQTNYDEHPTNEDETNLEAEVDCTTEQLKRTADIYRDPAGEPRGAAVWLNSTELTAAGVDVDEADAVEIRIEDGDLQLVPAGGDEN